MNGNLLFRGDTAWQQPEIAMTILNIGFYEIAPGTTEGGRSIHHYGDFNPD